MKKPRSNGKAKCGFCGDKFRTVKQRYQHAKDCTEKVNRKR